VKKTKLTAAYSAALLLITLFSLITRGTAATNYSLNAPQGLALDANGNLYVANTGASQVLVYNTSYAQLPAKTITHNVVNPSSLAFDGNGNLWVANAGNNTLTKYGPLGAQEGTPVGGIPCAIAIDGLGDLWVETNFATVTVYIDF
jgi:streptogramin lyase